MALRCVIRPVVATVVPLMRPPRVATAIRWSSTSSSAAAATSSSLNGRVAVIAGGTGGIGTSIAHELASRGAIVAVLSRSVDRARATIARLPSNHVHHMAIACNVTNNDSITDAINNIIGNASRIDILINTAGITSDSLLMRATPNDITSTLETNLLGPLLMSRAVLRPMIKQKYGRIISIGSIVGAQGNIGQVAYAASKAGLDGLTRSLSREVASRGITVNQINPGYITTSMTQSSMTDDMRARVLSRIPLGAFGTPQHVASAVAWLVSDEAAYINGQIIGVDGGLSL